MAVLTIPDMIFNVPTVNDLNPTGLIPQGGRLISNSPHVDGMIMAGPESLAKDSANLVLTRNAKGDWSLNRTAAGAETYNVRISPAELLRTGEVAYETWPSPGGAYPDKGIQLSDFFILYSVGVVALTSATLRFGKTVFSKTAGGAAFAQTDIVAATAIATATTPAAGQPQYALVAGPSPLVFSKDDLGLLEVEAVIVMANTGTLRIYGMGFHCNFNYN